MSLQFLYLLWIFLSYLLGLGLYPASFIFKNGIWSMTLFKFLICLVLPFLITPCNLRKAIIDIWGSRLFLCQLISNLGMFLTRFLYRFIPLFLLRHEDIFDNIAVLHSFLKLHLLAKLFNLLVFFSFSFLFLDSLNPHIFSIFRNRMRNLDGFWSLSSELFLFGPELFIFLLMIFDLNDVKNVLFFK